MLWVAVAGPSCLRPVDAAAPPGRSRRGRGGAGHRRVGGRPRGRSLSGPYGRSGREVGGRPTLTFFSNGRHRAQRPRQGEVRALLTSPRRWHDRAPRAIVPTAGGNRVPWRGASSVARRWGPVHCRWGRPTVGDRQHRLEALLRGKSGGFGRPLGRAESGSDQGRFSTDSWSSRMPVSAGPGASCVSSPRRSSCPNSMS